MRLADATVLITGASGGIGCRVARRLAAAHAQVVCHGRDTVRLDGLAAQLGVRTVAADLGASAGMDALLAEAGRVDAVVHCAGVGWLGPLSGMSGPDVERVLGLDLRVPVELTRRVLPAMVAAGRGHVCFVASIAGMTGVADEAVYSAAKAGVLAFADALRLELTGTGVEVSTVSPGMVATGFRPAGTYHRRIPRPISPDRVANSIVAAMSGSSPHRVVPRWLAIAPAVQAVSPGTYRRLAQRFG